ncbi:glucuronokinase [Catalinimonas alkaloidigena]|uniref:Glucuronokinase n=1 Tax=Catalinimonas alkaloidigena TaxID=1075417 RepID=A0A1G9QNS8_9BACT|nr:GHMP kinase [Catalinimonas alkaloidigena]SDM12491.1 glucuronokinase [Catalinimonas alkaloidigena]
MIIESRAYARAGLLGNPSDGYFGKTISIIVRNFGAHVSLYQTPELHIEPQEQDRNLYRNVYHLVESVSLTGYYGGSRLIKAAIRKFVEYCEQNHLRLSNRNFTIRYGSSIPRQIGLAGSSAIVTATMRALMQFYEVEIPLEVVPSLVLAAEKDELGINAGLQDRVIQAYEGCVYMDFDKELIERTGRGRYERLDPRLLPPLYIAYKTDLGKESGKVLNDVRQRYEKGDPQTLEALGQLAEGTERGRNAILERDYDTLHELIDRNFDLRCKIMNISDSNMELVETARRCGASAKFTGSGGSIIGMYHNDEVLNKLVVALKRINARVIKPYVF